MATFSLSGSDTAIIGGVSLIDVADGDWFTLTFPNQLAESKTGKNGNSIFALNATGLNADATARIIRGSFTDKQLDSLLQEQLQDFASFQLLDGHFVKRAGDGSGNITSDTYDTSAGIFTFQVDAKSNAEGDTDQSVSVYRFKFANGGRALF